MPFAGGRPRHAVPTLLHRLWNEILTDHCLMVAAGLAYYGLFGLLPAVAAAAAIWAQFADPHRLEQVLHDNGGLLPKPAVAMLDQFVTSVPTGWGGGLALALNLLLVVWTAYRAAGGLLTALHIVYDVKESRTWLRRSLVALVVGVSGIAILFVALGTLALAPLLAGPGLPRLWLRWPATVALLGCSYFLLLRYAPNRERPAAASNLAGAASATVLSLLASAGLTLYVARAGNYGRLYGSLGGIAIVLLWLYGTSLSLLVGAQVDDVLTRRREGARDPSPNPLPGREGS